MYALNNDCDKSIWTKYTQQINNYWSVRVWQSTSCILCTQRIFFNWAIKICHCVSFRFITCVTLLCLAEHTFYIAYGRFRCINNNFHMNIIKLAPIYGKTSLGNCYLAFYSLHSVFCCHLSNRQGNINFIAKCKIRMNLVVSAMEWTFSLALGL